MTENRGTETLGTADGHPALRIERRLAHPPERVWRALTEPEHLATWFPSDEVRVQLRPGGTITFVDRGDGPDTTGEVTDCDPPRVFGYRWGEDHLRWEVTPDGDGSVLTLVHTIADRPGAASFAAGWDVCLTAMAQHLDGAGVTEPGDMVAAHEERVARFGLDIGTVTRCSDGWQVFFERQLTAPAQVAWHALGGTDLVVGGPADLPDGATVTALRPTELLEFDVEGGHGRLTLGAGTGHGARLHVLRTGSDGDPDVVEQQWRAWVAGLAARVAAR